MILGGTETNILLHGKLFQVLKKIAAACHPWREIHDYNFGHRIQNAPLTDKNGKTKFKKILSYPSEKK